MADSLLPPSIRDDRFLAMEALTARLQAIDLSAIAVYNVDTVDSSALIHLAEQFNVLGRRGWNLCESEEQRRELIKSAIELHKYAGTAWAIDRSITAVGFAGAEVEENPPFAYDGESNGGITYDGYDSYSGQIWGGFRVFVDLGGRSLSLAQERLLVDLINEWKNRRSHLLSVGIRRSLLPYNGLPLTTYDGRSRWNGAVDYNQATHFYNGAQEYSRFIREVG